MASFSTSTGLANLVLGPESDKKRGPLILVLDLLLCDVARCETSRAPSAEPCARGRGAQWCLGAAPYRVCALYSAGCLHLPSWPEPSSRAQFNDPPTWGPTNPGAGYHWTRGFFLALLRAVNQIGRGRERGHSPLLTSGSDPPAGASFPSNLPLKALFSKGQARIPKFS